MKYKKGDKVVPISKSVWDSLEESFHWKEAKKINQGYLYINGFDKQENAYECVHESNNYGDFFLESDLIPYVDTELRTATRIVSKCNNCPMFSIFIDHHEVEKQVCQATNSEVENFYELDASTENYKPDWCPLKTQNILIKLQQDETKNS